MDWMLLASLIIKYLLPVMLKWLDELFKEAAANLAADTGVVQPDGPDDYAAFAWVQCALINEARRILVERKSRLWSINWIGHWVADARLNYFDAAASTVYKHGTVFAESAYKQSISPAPDDLLLPLLPKMGKDDLRYVNLVYSENARWL